MTRAALHPHGCATGRITGTSPAFSGAPDRKSSGPGESPGSSLPAVYCSCYTIRNVGCPAGPASLAGEVPAMVRVSRTSTGTDAGGPTPRGTVMSTANRRAVIVIPHPLPAELCATLPLQLLCGKTDVAALAGMAEEAR